MRIKETFTQLKKEQRAGLVTYIMAYDPDKATSQAILNGLPAAGADIIELGMPFSDPMADGPTIQKAAIRALKAGAKMAGVLEMVRAFRTHNTTTPLVLMGYYNPVQHYGVEAFCADAAASGADALLIVDVPPEEDEALFNATEKAGLALIRLATPTTDANRLQAITRHASGFLYYVAVAGVTGTRSASTASIEHAVRQLRAGTDLPIAVGFGIKTPTDVKAVAQHADAVVVGSSLVEKVSAGNTENALAFVRELAGKK